MRIAPRRTLQVIHFVLSIGASAVTIAWPLIGLLLGILHLPHGYGLLSKPGPVLTLMYVAMWMGWIWIGYTLLRMVKRRSDAKPHEDSFVTLMYVITVPVAVLWILTWGELLGWPNSGSGSPDGDFDSAFALFVFGGGALALGGDIAASTALSIDRFFNPGEYPEETKEPQRQS